MTRYVLRNGELVEKRYAPSASHHNVIRDDMAATRHPVTGKMMESKSQFRKVTRMHGLTEVGTETMRDTRDWSTPDLGRDIGRTIEQLSNRR